MFNPKVSLTLKGLRLRSQQEKKNAKNGFSSIKAQTKSQSDNMQETVITK